jgi:hypothetical protein
MHYEDDDDEMFEWNPNDEKIRMIRNVESSYIYPTEKSKKSGFVKRWYDRFRRWITTIVHRKN